MTFSPPPQQYNDDDKKIIMIMCIFFLGRKVMCFSLVNFHPHFSKQLVFFYHISKQLVFTLWAGFLICQPQKGRDTFLPVDLCIPHIGPVNDFKLFTFVQILKLSYVIKLTSYDFPSHAFQKIIYNNIVAWINNSSLT